MPLKRWPAVLAIGIPVLYLLFLTRTYYWDGVLFALQIESVRRGELPAAILFHPNHLVYSAFGYVLYSAASIFGLHARAITILQIFNAALSTMAGYALDVLAKRLTGCSLVAAFCWLLFATGATWWKFSTDADSYIVSVFLLILTMSFLFENRPNLVAAAACHTTAMLFHELAVFTYVPVLAAIAWDSERSKRARWWTSIAYMAGTGSVVGGVYLLAYVYANHAAYPTLFAWVTSYASDSGFTHSVRQIVSSYLSSYLKLFVGGKLALIRDYFSVTVCLSLAIALGTLVWAVLSLRRPQFDSQTRVDRRAEPVLWVWLLSYAVFLGSWDPGSAFHKLFVWPSIVLLAGLAIAKRTRLLERRRAFLALALAIGAWNFAAFIYPHSHASADPVLVLAETIDRQLPKQANIYYRVLDPDDWYLEYFAPGRFWSPINVASSRAYTGLVYPARGPVCFETTALDILDKDPIFTSQIDPSRRWDLVNARHNIRLECLNGSLAVGSKRPDSERPGRSLR
ncbi:MAG: hypothetical protein WB992_11800 [Bryobacteraceae bacterium]